MSTKIEPSPHCGYTKARPDEPFFTLLARDPDAAMIVQMWAFFRMKQIDIGLRPAEDRAQVAEAMRVATDMMSWQKAHTASQAMAAMSFDHNGQPMTGQHASDQHQASHAELRTMIRDLAASFFVDQLPWSAMEPLLKRAADLLPASELSGRLADFRTKPA